jgi:cytochrome c
MRRVSASALVMVTAAVLAGCGKKSEEQPVMPSSAPLSATAPESSAAPSPEQLKMLSALPAPFNGGDPAAGEGKAALCKSCHSFAKGGPNLTGPDLYGVFGTKSAEVAGFTFSDGMKAANLTWDAPTLDKWIQNPKTLVPTTKMTFNGVPDAKDRQDIIAFLAIQRDQ